MLNPDESDKDRQDNARRALNSWTDSLEALANGEADGAFMHPTKGVVDGVDLITAELHDQHTRTAVLLAISDGQAVGNIVDYDSDEDDDKGV